MKLQKYLLTFAVAIVSLFSPMAISANETQFGADWEYYSAFHNNPRRIMDGERYTYFFVYQQNYDTTNNDLLFGLPCGTLFYYDKQNPDNGIQSLFTKYHFTDHQMTIADYNPRTGMMVVCYEDGGIDLAEEDGTVTYISTIKDRTDSNNSKPINISFDLNNDVWIGLHNGFIHINGSTKEVKEAPEYGVAVNCITRVGDHVVAWMNSDIYDASADANLKDVHVFTASGIASGTSPQAFMPLSDTAFAYIATQSQVYLCKYSDGNWTTSLAINDVNNNSAGAFRSFATNAYYGNVLENNVIVNRDGYLLFNNVFAYQIYSGLTDSGTLNYKKRKMLWSSQNVLGSYDFDNFWYYVMYGRFAQKKADDGYDTSTKWTAVTADLDPNGARAYRRITMRYSPEYGLLTVNRGRDFNYEITKVLPVLLSGYKNGKWTDYSSPYVIPSWTTDGTTYTGTYKKNAYPAYDPQDLMLDPLYPQYAFMGSYWDGMFAIDMANPSGQVLHWGAPESESANLPGFKTTFPTASWRPTNPVVMAGDDADGNIWVLYNTCWHTTAGINKAAFMYLTPEARKEGLEAQDIDKVGEWGELICDYWSASKDMGRAFKHDRNRTKLIAFGSNNSRSLCIYDHKGTLADTSDDEQKYFTNFLNPYGGLRNFSIVMDIAEDPISGDVYIAHDGGIDVIDLDSDLVNGAMPAKPLSVKGPDNSPQYIGIASIITGICFDEYNRLWVSTMTDGIYGINTERTEIFAHYTAENSGLPDNYVYQACWNPEMKRLFISTTKGLSSVNPDEPGTKDAEYTLMAYPMQVDETYAGTIAVYNVSGISTIKVKDTNNNVVAMLPEPENNTTYWNLLDDKGKNVPSGRYTIYDANGYYKSVEVTVVR